MPFQMTTRRQIECSGIGLHSGKKVNLVLKPAPPDTGIVFRRNDVNGFEVKAAKENISTINYATSLCKDSVHVGTIEHLLSALLATEIDNLFVEISAREIPIMDGSAAPFVYLIHEAGYKRQPRLRKYLRILKPIRINKEDKSIAIYPSNHFRISYTIKFNHPLIKYQTCTLKVVPQSYADLIAPARTFCFLRDVEFLRRLGLTLGGSLDNAVVLDDYSILNDKLRFVDEFVRHKILDAIGDLALLGHPILGHVVVFRGGHALHNELVSRILASPDAWVLDSLDDEQEAAAPAPALVPGAAAQQA